MKKFLIAAVMAAILAGCSTQPSAPVDDQSTDAAAAAAAASKSGATTSGVTTAGVSGASSGSGTSNALRDPNNILSKRSVYFDFDSFVVEDKYKALIEAHAKYLANNKTAKVTLQGHTDERGSREYNIALGQKRAEAVKRVMILMGAQEVVIETVSYGKEKPKREGHDEAAWAENRRVDIVYFGE
ncbi:MAG TPA: peptidoglycan-associated lipoprotein Pal [Casimicrobiaceae bacterium]|nr:peptidoglycan-associated lipoprotein Pal [Casimicrobiaceae bacterium]